MATHERCKECGRKYHPGEMVTEQFTGRRMCYRCAGDPKILEKNGSGVV